MLDRWQKRGCLISGHDWTRQVDHGSKVGIGVAAIATVLVVAGCSGARDYRLPMPKPVAYDEAT